jgi:hypothetical protein
MRVPGTYKDRGHYLRKGVFYGAAALLFLPWVACLGLGYVKEGIDSLGQRLHRWSHPCLYVRRMPKS